MVLHTLTAVKSDMLWKKGGTPGRVTVMEGVGPEPAAPGTTTPPSREPRIWARFPSELPTEVVLVVWVDVCPEVLAKEGGGMVVAEDDVEVEEEG